MNTDKLTEPAIIILIEYLAAAWLVFATEERAGKASASLLTPLTCVHAGIVDTMSSTPTERKPDRLCHWAVAVEWW